MSLWAKGSIRCKVSHRQDRPAGLPRAKKARQRQCQALHTGLLPAGLVPSLQELRILCQ